MCVWLSKGVQKMSDGGELDRGGKPLSLGSVLMWEANTKPHDEDDDGDYDNGVKTSKN